jgi:hypothetical protein
LPVADKKKIFSQSGVTLNGFHRVYGLQPGLKNLHGMFTHLLNI